MYDICVVFDLDDTLYKEIEFVKSGYLYFAKQVSSDNYLADLIYKILLDAYISGKNAFDELINLIDLNVSKYDFLNMYRTHCPEIRLSECSVRTLAQLKAKCITMGLITDGRSVTQRNKIVSLGIERYIHNDNIVISEEFGSAKPAVRNYEYFMTRYPQMKRFVYVGDNPEKDFIAPNRLGWITIGLKDNGMNVHKQRKVDAEHNPGIWVSELNDIITVLNIR